MGSADGTPEEAHGWKKKGQYEESPIDESLNPQSAHSGSSHSLVFWELFKFILNHFSCEYDENILRDLVISELPVDSNIPISESFKRLSDQLGFDLRVSDKVSSAILGENSINVIIRDHSISLLTSNHTGSSDYCFDLQERNSSTQKSLHKLDSLYFTLSKKRLRHTITLQWVFRELSVYKAELARVFITSLSVQVLALAPALSMQVIIDKVVQNRSESALQALLPALVVIGIAEFLFGHARSKILTKVAHTADSHLINSILERILNLPYDLLRSTHPSVLAASVKDLQKIREFVSETVLTTLVESMLGIIYFAILVNYNIYLSFIALAPVPIQYIVSYLSRDGADSRFRKYNEASRANNLSCEEAFSSLPTIKSFGAEHNINNYLKSLHDQMGDRLISKSSAESLLKESSKYITRLSQLLVLVFGAYFVIKGSLTLGQLIAFRILSSQTVNPLVRMTDVFRKYTETTIAVDNVNKLLAKAPKRELSAFNKIGITTVNARKFYSEGLQLSLNKIFFKYPDQSQILIRNVTSVFKSGEISVITGMSGSGKSTMAKLIAGLETPLSGEITLNQINISRLKGSNSSLLYAPVVYLPQFADLISGTISQNITMFQGNIDYEKLVESCRLACIYNYLIDLPESFETHIDSYTNILSGGQVQRLALARVFYANPEILILDESMSAIDPQTALIIKKNLITRFSQKIIIAISHYDLWDTAGKPPNIYRLSEGQLLRQP